MSKRITYLQALHAQPNPDGTRLILREGNGLMLWVQSSGIKAWRCKVQRNGRNTTLTLGYFPAMTPEDARAARMDMRTATDPARDRRLAKAPLTTPERARDIAQTLAGSALRLAELGAEAEARFAKSRSTWWLDYALVLDRTSRAGAPTP
jgi:hypothetical protein